MRDAVMGRWSVGGGVEVSEGEGGGDGMDVSADIERLLL